MKDRSSIKSIILYSFILVFTSQVFLSGVAYGLELTSSAFKKGGNIPVRYTAKGEDISPPLSWSSVPRGTKSFALFLDDPDATMGTWIHWVIYNIPGNMKGLKENVPKKMTVLKGASQGINSFRWIGYGGPHPPPGPEHRYFFRLYALDAVLNLPPGASKGKLINKMQGHILGRATYIGTFSQKKNQ